MIEASKVLEVRISLELGVCCRTGHCNSFLSLYDFMRFIFQDIENC